MRQNVRLFFLGLFVLFFVIAIGGGLFWGNFNYVKRFSGGEQFIFYWQSTRTFLVQGLSPYSDLAALDIQRAIYHRPAIQAEEQYHFLAPLFVTFYNIPLAAIVDWRSAFALALIFMQAGLIATVFLSVRLSNWRSGIFYLVLCILFSFLWLPGAVALRTGSPILLQTFLLVAALRAADSEIDELAGGLLALAAFNLEVLGPAILLILFWAASSSRWRIWGGFFMVFSLLAVAAYMLFPAWPLQYVRSVYQYWADARFITLLQVFAGWFPALGARLAQFIVVIVVSVLLLEWYAVRQRNITWLFWTVSLTLVATPLLGMPVLAEYQIAFLPAMILILSVMAQRWGVFGGWSALLVQIAVVVIPWLAAQAYGMQSSMVLLLLPVVLFVMLYWVRWWVARPARLWADLAAGYR